MAQHTKPRRRGRGLFYGWWLAALASLVGGLATGPVSSGMGVWLRSLETQFHWSRTQLTGAFSIAQMEGIIVVPLAGLLVDRLGSRGMVLIGLLVIGVGFVVFSRTTSLVLFYGAFAILMLGMALGTNLPMMTVVNRWFIRNRSTAVAIAGEGNYLGGFLLVPVLAWAVSRDHFGWETTALWIGVVFLLVAFPLSRLVRNRPEDYGERPDGDPPPDPSAPLPSTGRTGQHAVGTEDRPDFTARQAMRTSSFWLMAVGHAFSSMVNQTLMVHLVPMLTDKGYSLQVAAYVLAVVMGVGAVFNLVGGFVGDRMSKNLAYFIFVTIQAAGFAMAVMVQNIPMAFAFAVIYGIGGSGRIPISVSIRSDYFGQRSFATIAGFSSGLMHACQLIAPLFAAIMFDIRDSYVIPFNVLASLGFLSGALYLLAKKPVPIGSIQATGQPGGRF